MGSADHWLQRISDLRVDKARGDHAPHKPLLLLVVCDLAEQGLLRGSTLALTPELASRFMSYWPIVAYRRKQGPDVRLPFYHLAGDGIWSPLDKEGRPARTRRDAWFAELPSDFRGFLNDPAARDRARHLLIAKYFRPSERIALYESLGMPVPPDTVIEQNAAYRSPLEAKKAGREARFRNGVMAAYDFTCALTGYRLVTITSGSIVEAAHIHKFADSRNNEIPNGLALSRNAHWLFDQGLWTISDDYRVVVALGAFSERAENESLLFERLNGESLHLPDDRSLWPSPIHLAWHRRKKFAVS